MRLRLVLILFIFYFWMSVVEASYVFVRSENARGEKGKWYLEVDGKPFYIKGVGCGIAIGRNGLTDYLKLAKELGANTVRTWGTDQGSKEYLDLAQRYGLKVCASIWLNYVDEKGNCSYLYDNNYKNSKRQEVLEYVRKFKDHPAILMWGVGNEALFFTKDEREKVALSIFLEELIKDIHEIDPNHPVVYASASSVDLPYLASYVPSLDIVGMNEYGSIRTAHGKWEYLGFDKPYVFTEYGPYLSSDRPKDVNGKAVELSDIDKAKRYKEFNEQIYSFKGYNLGGFVFHLGETTQESMTWWNLNEGDLKRASYWAIYEFYTGKKAPYAPIRVKSFSVSKIMDIEPSEEIEARVDIGQGVHDNLIFNYALSSCEENVLKYYVNEYVPVEISGQGCKVKIKVPSEKGVYRVYCYIKDDKGNVASQNKTIRVK
ncbi:MAG: glycoside hydrolase family 2 TIM barrel-domain containing protein [Candidatus Omnitrophota bacterium]